MAVPSPEMQTHLAPEVPVSLQDTTAPQENETERPLVTFALFAYNQEKYIREAIEGAFSQTYTPLEIILSDDCSTDRTFEIMKEMAEAYQGRHKLILNRNEKNLFIGGHVNRVFELSAGELVVMAAGDDISLPERVFSLVSAWLDSGKSKGIASAVINISDGGQNYDMTFSNYEFMLERIDGIFCVESDVLIQKFLRRESFWVLGGAAAWPRKLWENYSKIPNWLMYEDVVMTFRCALEDGLMLVPNPLVKYRRCNSSISNSGRGNRTQSFSASKRYAKKLALDSQRSLDAIEVAIEDFNISKISNNPKLKGFLRRRFEESSLSLNWWNLGFFSRVLNLRRSPFRSSIIHSCASVLGLNIYSLFRSLLFQVRSLISGAKEVDDEMDKAI